MRSDWRLLNPALIHVEGATMKTNLHAELTKTKAGRAIAILNGFPGGNDAMLDAKQIRTLIDCLVKVADALEAGKSGEIEQQYSLDYRLDVAD